MSLTAKRYRARARTDDLCERFSIPDVLRLADRGRPPHLDNDPGERPPRTLVPYRCYLKGPSPLVVADTLIGYRS